MESEAGRLLATVVAPGDEEDRPEERVFGSLAPLRLEGLHCTFFKMVSNFALKLFSDFWRLLAIALFMISAEGSGISISVFGEGLNRSYKLLKDSKASAPVVAPFLWSSFAIRAPAIAHISLWLEHCASEDKLFQASSTAVSSPEAN